MYVCILPSLGSLVAIPVPPVSSIPPRDPEYSPVFRCERSLMSGSLLMVVVDVTPGPVIASIQPVDGGILVASGITTAAVVC